MCFFFLLWRCDPTRVMASSFLRFLDHTQRRNTIGRTPLDEWSARRTHNTHNRQTSMHPVGFEPTISVGERPQTYALGRAATGTSVVSYYMRYITVHGSKNVRLWRTGIMLLNISVQKGSLARSNKVTTTERVTLIHEDKSNKIEQCIKILFYVKLNMFRATHRPSSGA